MHVQIINTQRHWTCYSLFIWICVCSFTGHSFDTLCHLYWVSIKFCFRFKLAELASIPVLHPLASLINSYCTANTLYSSYAQLVIIPEFRLQIEVLAWQLILFSTVFPDVRTAAPPVFTFDVKTYYSEGASSDRLRRFYAPVVQFVELALSKLFI